MTAYDNWKCTDVIAEKNAEYDARLEAKALQIRSDMVVSDWWSEIEGDLCVNPAYTMALITIASGNFEAGGEMIKKLADKWMDNRAVELASESLAGGDE